MKYITFISVIILILNFPKSSIGNTMNDHLNIHQKEDTTLFLGQIINVSIVYYFDGENILSGNEEILDKVVIFLNENPNVAVEVVSHTDTRGLNSYNLTLSKKRANAIVDYLINKGIDKNRLVPVGKGETELLLTDDYIRKHATTKPEQELLHQRNRRTELKIISLDYQKN